MWPVGADHCSLGCPWGNVAFSGGSSGEQPTPDESAAGVRGYIPTTVLNYYTWAGTEATAWVQGDQFLTMPGTGSTDLGGSDAISDCSITGACTQTNVLFALGPGDQKIRISLKPNVGTTADLLIDNKYGGLAGHDLTGVGSGLQAGTTVNLNDPLTNANGATTTYKWEVETRCPNTNSILLPQTIQGPSRSARAT